jgi:xeroderma pigmentosum group C-complementing protein
MRSGRTVKEGEQPMKMVKAKASTVGRMREINTLKEAGESQTGREGATELMQGLYAWNQTELYEPLPVIDVSLDIYVNLQLL